MPELPLTEPSITVAEFAQRQKLCTHTVYRLIRSGEIPAIRLGRSIRIPEGSMAPK